MTCFFFFKQKTAYGVCSSDWSSDVCSSDLDPDQPANRYRFGAKAKNADDWRTLPTSRLLGGNWGHGMFQLGACDFCDDIFAETADVCLGDAWLPQYDSDWRGTNIVISRHADIDQLLREGARSGEIMLEDLNGDRKRQSRNFSH